MKSKLQSGQLENDSTISAKLRLIENIFDSLPEEIGDCLPPQWSSREFSRDEIGNFWQNFFEKNQTRENPIPLMLYLNVPFCRTHCSFCHFETILAGRNTALIDEYVQHIINEVQYYQKRFGRMGIASAAIGGGTPSQLSPHQLSKLMRALFANAFELPEENYFNAEFNPDTTTKEKLKILVDYGLKRFSIGIQSLNPATLKEVHRGYQTEKMVFDAAEIAHQYQGLTFVVDLLAPMPQETITTFSQGVDKTLSLKPDEIIFYEYQYIERLRNPMQKGQLDYQLAREILTAKTQAQGFDLISDFGTSIVFSKKTNKTYPLKYSPNPRIPAAVMGLGNFSESYVFGEAHYITQNDLGARKPCRGFVVDENIEKSLYLSRKILNNFPVKMKDYKSTFRSSVLKDFKPEIHFLIKSAKLQRSPGLLIPQMTAKEEMRRYSYLFFSQKIFSILKKKADENAANTTPTDLKTLLHQVRSVSRKLYREFEYLEDPAWEKFQPFLSNHILIAAESDQLGIKTSLQLDLLQIEKKSIFLSEILATLKTLKKIPIDQKRLNQLIKQFNKFLADGFISQLDLIFFPDAIVIEASFSQNCNLGEFNLLNQGIQIRAQLKNAKNLMLQIKIAEDTQLYLLKRIAQKNSSTELFFLNQVHEYWKDNYDQKLIPLFDCASYSRFQKTHVKTGSVGNTEQILFNLKTSQYKKDSKKIIRASY